ncbi:MAG: insulinase family protein, partial [Hyphomicrobiales bacterium]|nr:insulinase family protein [Hyphomicrobiales bacterium]
MPIALPFKTTLLGAIMTIAAALVPPGAEAVNIKEVISPGGITAWLVEDYTVPIVTMNVAFRGGAAQEDDDKAGLANLMSGLLDEGAGELDSKTFQTRLQDLNVDLSFDAGRDAFYGNLRTLSTNRDAAFELFRLALNEPRFDAEPVERIRGQVISGLKRSETDPQEIAGRAWAAALFGRHPYGRPSDGTIKTVEAISADDLKAFHKRIIARDNLHIAVVGAIDPERLKTVLDAIFGNLPENAQLKPITEILPRDGASDHVALSVPQTIIRVGGRGLKRNDPDFIAAYVANHILGGGSFSSRLYAEIREKRGLAYSVGTGLAAYDHAGAYIGAAATRADQAQTAIDIMTGQIKEFAESGPSEAELEKAKSYLIGNYALRFDASQKIARQLIGIQLDRLGIDYIDKRNDLIRAVTKE